jgi:hypothetical protein
MDIAKRNVETDLTIKNGNAMMETALVAMGNK